MLKMLESGTTSYRGPTGMPADGKVFDLKLIPEFDGSSQPVAEWLEKAELQRLEFKVAFRSDMMHLLLTEIAPSSKINDVIARKR
ncbi:hypothetical protein M514_20785 [Trichuris suis]|uniref:Uncharacterized protein n=1 Tax=Trichuris suis TaxID=68888 RepID=A0A085NBS3_9BILA|nr:hypothetical protein M514_20785 [Trichuris suis]